MTDLSAVVIAVAAVVGAVVALNVPWWLGAAPLLLGVLLRRPLVIAAAVALLSTGLAARAWAGVQPMPEAPFRGVVTLTTDPERAFGAARAIARTSDGRVEMWARGPTAGRLSRMSAGDHVPVVGSVRAPPGSARHRLAVRHVRGRLTVVELGDPQPGAPLARAANRIRAVLARGARTMTPAERSLYLGLLIGDDRAMSDDTKDQFRSAGLSHLTAVSGQNVALLLAALTPLLALLSRRPRYTVTLGVLAWFAVITRLEPSVLRATAMAALAATAVVLGRVASALRLLALAVAALVVVDPLLVHQVGFQLSVGATLGLAVLAGPLARRLRGPRAIVEALAATIAAQLGAAPVSLAVFGPLPLAALPANVAAAPAVGPLTAWGLPAGLLAAWLPDTVARLLQLPTRLGLWWLHTVASVGARLPLGHLSAPHLAVVAAGGAIAARSASSRSRAIGAGLVAIALLSAVGSGWLQGWDRLG